MKQNDHCFFSLGAREFDEVPRHEDNVSSDANVIRTQQYYNIHAIRNIYTNIFIQNIYIYIYTYLYTYIYFHTYNYFCQYLYYIKCV